MSDNKKYYWLKLQENFFNTDDIKILRKKDNGDIYVIIWQKLLLKAITQREIGILYYKEKIPYDMEMLADVLDENINHIKGAFEHFIKLKMVALLEDGGIWIEEAIKFVGSETNKAELMRRLRAKRVTQLPDVTKCRPELELELELEKEVKSEDFNNPLIPTKEREEKVKSKSVLKSKDKLIQTTNTIKSDEQKKIKEKLRSASLEIKGEEYYHDAKEAACLAKLAKRAPLNFVMSKIDILCKKIKGVDPFWQEQPVCPSSVLALWNRLTVTVSKHNIKPFEEV